MKHPEKLPWTISSLCDGCASCFNACPLEIIVMAETEHDGFSIPILKNYEDCIGCGKCADICSMGGIAMTAYVCDAEEKCKRDREKFLFQKGLY
ncbi:4Fe-4S dicluster domain-containing protein [Acetobacterium tundrae]|uniref:4Fe-4S dicluster domain-containing protein n=1 Tax=Acetobacterium tundrae TaxID=132932 RepID=A0ABR6WKX1_9FIRM|nr:4Fe-4S dicluster domain-containing protein [Acetobacterium tundrae]MBC3796896.1 4Fe-4S dicluster domain-containing protein [Acetobacterium tundrae]